ncbi:MAG: ATPase [Betaproteobacteria bacterium]|nr:ATPase [Betaproteobacteria bacterium]
MESKPLDGPSALRVLLRRLEDGLLERDTAARLVLLAAVAAEHVLLIGPPGTAKSELARRLQAVMAPAAAGQGQACFERLLTRFSTPEELFGPLSLKALEDDRYERLVEGYLPTAQVAFLDEVFKANSAILNALLSLLNERVFDNGTQRLRVPLVSVVAASNETPTDEALHAFFDRFLIRVPVQPVSDGTFERLLSAPAGATGSEPPATPLGEAERHAIAHAAHVVTLGPETLAALQSLRQFLRGLGSSHATAGVSDRRWRQLARLLRVAAAAEGKRSVEPEDLWLAAYVVPADMDQVPVVLRWWQDTVLQVGTAESPGWQRSTEAFEKQLEIETRAQAEEGAQAAGKMALARSVGGTDNPGASGEMLRLYSARMEERLRKHWSPLHIRARTAQVRELGQTVHGALAEARQAFDEWQARLNQRLWLPPSLTEQSLEPLRQRIAVLSELFDRLQAVEAGFAGLPVDESLAEVPAPISVAPPG